MKMAIVLKQLCIDETKRCPCAPPPSPQFGVRKKFCFEKCSPTPFTANESNEVDIREFLVASLSRMNVGSSSLKRKQRTETNEYAAFDICGPTPNSKKIKSSGLHKQALLPLITAVNGSLVVEERKRELLQLKYK